MDEEELWSRRQIDWLSGVAPEEWHRVALDFNWDNRLDALHWMVQQPECDRATALTIFWLAQPTAWHIGQPAMADAADKEALEVSIVRTIAERLHAKSYQRAKIAFDATPLMKQDYAELVAGNKAGESGLRAHPDMVRSIGGQEIRLDRAFYARYPADFHGSTLIELPETARDLVTPLMKEARTAMATVILNLMALGAVTAFLAGNGAPRSSTALGWITALLAIGLCGHSSRTNLQTFRGILRAEQLEMPSLWIRATLVLSLLCGAGLGLAYRYVFLGQVQAMLENFGRVATTAAGLAVVVPLLWLVASGAARLLVYRVIFR